MTEIGKKNRLRIVKILDFGAYLDGDEKGEILLPIKQVPEDAQIDDELDVFIYNDSEDRIIATTTIPFAMADEFAFLEVVAVNKFGAFLDWGLVKDLLVPFREQKMDMEIGRWYVVYIYLDEQSQRLVATAKVDKYIDNIPPEYEPNQEVDIMIYSRTDLGYKAIINNTHWGVLYENEIFKPLNIGDKMKAFIKKVREDDKIDLYLNKSGYNQIDRISEDILAKLEENNNFLAISDKSEPQKIYETFGISKKAFKKAIGNLYKNHLITLENNGIKLN